MIKLITKLGLTQNEANVYLSLLELGPSLVTEISNKSKVSRVTCYDVLEKLVKYNLVTYASGKQAKKRYAAMPPHNLIDFLKRKQKRKEKQLEELGKKLPELRMMYKEPNRPSIKFFEDTEGLKAIYSETLKSKTEILAVADCEEWQSPDLIAWGRQYNRERTKNKIYERILIPAGEKTIDWFKNYPTTLKYTEYRILPKEKINYLFDSEINIFEDKVMIALLKKPNRMGILITSKHLVNILKAMFEMAWEATEKYNRNDRVKKVISTKKLSSKTEKITSLK
ncbi:MAG: helix-turn-helix domain-containing protein [Patescibacteria group bacterium]|nr:helix-turn-helix domain-containing protein [Patescibacteria group bacterium]MDD5294350.1 helix-turn-helix domain-containing protein [Patescibacteria group bacterium]MDD5554033.1 helix-turn-helix domain-containing protein [Patescibacteria group bacterium]